VNHKGRVAKVVWIPERSGSDWKKRKKLWASKRGTQKGGKKKLHLGKGRRGGKTNFARTSERLGDWGTISIIGGPRGNMMLSKFIKTEWGNVPEIEQKLAHQRGDTRKKLWTSALHV